MGYVRSVLDKTKFKVDKTFKSINDIVNQILIFVATLITLCWFSAFFYGTFYYYYVPVVLQEKQVYFQFSVCEDGVGMCSLPTANVSLAEDGHNEVFKPGQVYKIFLDVDLPESPINRQIAMFMIEMQLYNRDGETVVTSSRPVSACLNYRSELLRVMDTLVFAPFFLFGYMEQKQSLNVELFSNFVDSFYNPAVGVVIRVHSKKVEMYKTMLRIFAQFSGLRYFLFFWPVTSAVVGITANFILLSFITLLSWYRFSLPGNKKPTARKVVKIDLSRNRQPTPSVGEYGKKAVLSSGDLTETLGANNDGEDPDETSVMLPSTNPLDSGLRLRQSHTS